MSKTTVTISGNLSVRTTRVAPTNASIPLAAQLPLSRVRVFVEGRRGNGVWNNIGEAETDANGNFTINNKERDRDRRYRIQVRFKSDDLVVRDGVAAGWETVLEQARVRAEDLLGVNLVFGDKAASSLDTQPIIENAAMHEKAETWALSRLLLNLLDQNEQPFGRLLEIVTSANRTFADPVRRNVYLQVGQSLSTIFHEVMHLWAYDHTRPVAGGQLRLIASLTGGGTHELQEARTTAFHEGFAEYAAKQVVHLLFNTPRPLPRSRFGLADLGLNSNEEMLHNDHAWESILTTLSTSGLRELSFGIRQSGSTFVSPIVPPPPATVLTPFVSFRRMLGCFARDSEAGEHQRLGSGKMRELEGFLKRIEAIVGGNMNGRVDEYLRLFDINETVEPLALFT